MFFREDTQCPPHRQHPGPCPSFLLSLPSFLPSSSFPTPLRLAPNFSHCGSRSKELQGTRKNGLKCGSRSRLWTGTRTTATSSPRLRNRYCFFAAAAVAALPSPASSSPAAPVHSPSNIRAASSTASTKLPVVFSSAVKNRLPKECPLIEPSSKRKGRCTRPLP